MYAAAPSPGSAHCEYVWLGLGWPGSIVIIVASRVQICFRQTFESDHLTPCDPGHRANLILTNYDITGDSNGAKSIRTF